MVREKKVIEIGTKVRETNNPESIGVVVKIGYVDGIIVYTVRFPGRTRNLSESSIAVYSEKVEVIDNLINGKFGEFNDFQKMLTHYKLLSSDKIQNNIYSINSSRTVFYEYQFKPLMKFLSSPKRRIMICDEVGLGKTIEAGLIIKELDARRELNRILVVVPANLMRKWSDEMFFRFNDTFTVINAREFTDIIEEKSNTRNKYAKNRFIISIESIRSKKMMDTLDDTDYQWDLLIVDEAHSLRNSSQQHAAIKKISTACDSIVFLTATPIHTERRNLFNIMNILDEQQFPYYDSFENQLLINEPVIEALSLISQIPPQIERAIEALASLESVYLNNAIFQDVMASLRDYRNIKAISEHDELEKIVDIQMSLSDLHFLGNTYTRTRKRDVTICRAERKPQTRKIAFSPEEQAYYGAIMHNIREHSSHSFPTSVFVTFNVQRMLSSSLHAHSSRLISKYIQDSECQDFIDLEESIFDCQLADGYPQFPDSKFEELTKLLIEIQKHTSKVILFAFYIPTLKYLEKRLTERNFKTYIMHGQAKMDRTKVINDFRHQRGFSIMLSSRVGSEGIDLQFCDTLVNYDLPWNPMEIEQRIGRIDRIGQKSPFLNIYNFSMKDTIDDEIVTRLYDRISLFEKSIGLLEPIMGEILDRITKNVFFNNLSDEDRLNQFKQEEMTLAKKIKDLQLLEDKSSEILSLDYFYEHEIKNIKGKNRYISPEQLYKYLIGFFGVNYPDSMIKYDLHSNIGEMVLCESFIRDIHLNNVEIELPYKLDNRTSKPIKFTMDSDSAFENSDLTFINVLHPLIKYITKKYDENESNMLNTHFFCISGEDLEKKGVKLPIGYYFFFLNTGSIYGLREQSYIMPVIMNEDLESIGTRVFTEHVMSILIENGKPSIHKSMCDDEEYLKKAYEREKEIFLSWFIKLYQKQEVKQELILSRKEESIRYNYERKIQHQYNERQEILSRSGEPDKSQRFRIEMIDGKINKLNQNLEKQLVRIEAERNLSWSFEEPVMGGVFEVL